MGFVAVFAVSGCSGDAEPQAAVKASSPAVTTPSATVSNPVVEPAPVAACGVAFIGSAPFVLRGGWELVTASRGARDHAKWVDEFSEEVDELADKVRREPTIEEQAACGLLEISDLNFQVAVLNAAVGISGVAEADDYEKVANAANVWVQKLGAAADTAEPFTPTYTG